MVEASVRERRVAALKSRMREHRASLVATAESVAGAATCTNRGEDPEAAWPLERGVRLGRGATVRVQKGRVLLRFEDGSDVWLRAGSVLEIDGWSDGRRSVSMREGNLLAFVARAAGRPFDISTPAGAVAVTGTAFELTAGPGRFAVAVVHGSVEASRGEGRWSLRRREGLMLTPSGEPVRFDARAAVLERWSDALEASASNARIGEAFGAFSAWAGRDDGSPRRSGTKAAVVVALLAAALGGLWYGSGGSGNLPPAPGGEFGAPVDGHFQKHDGQADPKPGETRRFVRRIKGPDGDVTMPMEGMEGDLPFEDAPPEALATHEALQGMNAMEQVRSGAKAVDALVAEGVPRDEARRRVAEGMAASLRRQMEAMTGKQVDVEVTYEGSDDGKDRFGVMVKMPSPSGGGQGPSLGVVQGGPGEGAAP